MKTDAGYIIDLSSAALSLKKEGKHDPSVAEILERLWGREPTDGLIAEAERCMYRVLRLLRDMGELVVPLSDYHYADRDIPRDEGSARRKIAGAAGSRKTYGIWFTIGIPGKPDLVYEESLRLKLKQGSGTNDSVQRQLESSVKHGYMDEERAKKKLENAKQNAFPPFGTLTRQRDMQ